MAKPDMKAEAMRDLLPLLDVMEARLREALAVLKKLDARLTRQVARGNN